MVLRAMRRQVFERAISYNEPKKIYLHLVNIYERTDKHDVRHGALCRGGCDGAADTVCALGAARRGAAFPLPHRAQL